MTLRSEDKWNAFSVLRHPKKTVHDSFDLPSIPIAIILVLLPVILWGIFLLVLGIPPDYFVLAVGAVVALLEWVVFSAIVFACAKAFGKNPEASFTGTATAVSLLKVIAIAITVLSFIVLLVVPNAVDAARAEQKGISTPEQTYSIISTAANQLPEFTLWAIGAIIVIMFIFGLFALYLMYSIVSEAFKLTAFKHIILTIIFLIIFGLLGLLLYG